MLSGIQEVRSWAAAQRSVAFPVHRPRAPAVRITVRPWTASQWPTVSSVHEFRGAKIRLKQLVDRWGPSVFPPLLSYMAGNPGGGGDRLYGPPLTVFRVGGMPVAHAGHFYGKEAGLALARMVALDIVVQEGRLGPEGLRAFLEGLSWAETRLSPARYRRPLYEWSWELREQRHLWSYPVGNPWPRHLEWSRPLRRVDFARDSRFRPPQLPGFSLDCVGVGQNSSGTEFETRLVYRPRSGHAPIVATYLRGAPAPELRGGLIYRLKRTRIASHPALAVRVPSVGSSMVVVEFGISCLVLTVPSSPRATSPDRDLKIANLFVRALEGPR
jgi:hypothetical protein